MSTTFKLCFPPYWLYFCTLKPVFWGVGKVLGFPKRVMNAWVESRFYPKSTIGKFLFWTTWIYIAIPGTIPLTALWIASKVGYEKEAQAVLDTAMAAMSWSWDTAVFGFKVAKKAVEMAMVMM